MRPATVLRRVDRLQRLNDGLNQTPRPARWRPPTDAPCIVAVAAGEEDVWLSENGKGAARAKRACDSCPDQVRCLWFGLDETFGVYGGTTHLDRIRIRRYRETGDPDCLTVDRADEALPAAA